MKNKKDQCLTAQILIGLTMLGSVWGLPVNRAEAADSASNQSRVISTAESLDAGYISAGRVEEAASDAAADANTLTVEKDGSLVLPNNITDIDIEAGYALSSAADGTVEANGNQLSIHALQDFATSASGSKVRVTLYGGYAENNAAVLVTVQGNQVLLDGGSYARISGGYLHTQNGKGVAANNAVVMNGGSADNVCGAYAVSQAVVTATGNTVTLNGGTITGSVVGAEIDAIGLGSAAVHNTVNILGGSFQPANDDRFVVIAGGSNDYQATDNTINLASDAAHAWLLGGEYFYADGEEIDANQQDFLTGNCMVYGELSKYLGDLTSNVQFNLGARWSF